MKKKRNIQILISVLAYILIVGAIYVAMVKRDFSEQRNHLEYFVGMACGLLAGFAVVGLVLWLIRKLGGKIGCKCKDNSYDERQLLARGQAYKYAFFTMIGYVVFAGFLKEIAEQPLLMSFAGMWLGVCIAVAVFAIVCILNDAYMNLYENAKGIILLFGFIGVMNFGIGIWNVWNRKVQILKNGCLSIDSINLIVGGLFLILLFVFVGRAIYNNRQLAQDEE